MAEAFINSATSLLVGELDRLIRSRPDFADSASVAEKFEAFRHTCTITPSIVGYIAERITNTRNEPAFNSDQLELLKASVHYWDTDSR